MTVRFADADLIDFSNDHFYGSRLQAIPGHPANAVLDDSQADGVSIGVQCDMTRFADSDDPVEWDVFQNTIHAQQGWTIHRVWTPHFFRDPDGHLKTLRTAIEQQGGEKPTAAEDAGDQDAEDKA